MASVDDPRIPDIGTVDEAFTTLDGQIGSLPDYAKPVWSRTRERLHTAHTKLNQSPSPSNGRGTSKFAEAITKLVTLLAPYTTQVLAGRVIQHLKLHKKLHEIHHILDILFRDLNFQESEDWRPALKRDVEDHAVALQQQIGRPALKTELERDSGLYRETMTLLKHAKGTLDSELWNPLAQKMYEIALLVDVPTDVRNEALAPVPAWFVPPMSVTYHPTPFATGSFGAVHRGTWGSGANVVVKILLDMERLGSLLMKDFLKEANYWYQFTHPNCARMFGASHVSLPPYILCEDATNGNLADYLARGEGDESHLQTQVWRRLFEASLGLEYLHEKGVVHGDLKLNNMLVGADGYTRITDFGLSRVKSATKTKSMSTTKRKDGQLVVGALRWLAPECFQNGPDYPSDVYALGMSLYEAFAGEPPFAYLDDVSARTQIEQGALPKALADADGDAWALVQAMTKKDLSQRLSLKEAIAKIKHLARNEAAEENSKFVLCVQCQTRLPKGSNFCNKCGMHVGTKPVEDEIIRIGSAKDLARIINMLAIGVDRQKKSCLKALLDYVFGDPQRQQKVRDAGAIPILVKLLDDIMVSPATYPRPTSIEDDVLVDSLLTLGSIYAVNEPLQDTAAFEGTIKVLEKALAQVPDGRDDRRRAKAAMAVGLLADSHPKNQDEVPHDVLAAIRGFASSTSEVLRNGGTRALNHMQLPLPVAHAG